MTAPDAPAASTATADRVLRRVVVDFTPLLPGGANGGAKPLCISLMRLLAECAPEVQFILLTSAQSHGELADLDTTNVSRLCVVGENVGENVGEKSGPTAPAVASSTALRRRVRRALARTLPPRALAWLDTAALAARRRPRSTSLIRRLGADLLFCPFTAPYYADRAVPTVAQIYDLQYAAYPRFFPPEERAARHHNLVAAARIARRLVCMTAFVRATLLAHTSVPADRVVVIQPRLFGRLPTPAGPRVDAVLRRLGLADGDFLLYPANFWPHKNHAMLLTAFGMYRSAHPASRLKLVCTGEPDAGSRRVAEAATRMRLADHVVLTGYVPEHELAALYGTCRALIFPSLYEGFGLPLLEAMAHNRPVLASSATSLPEVGGDAALYFDPRRPRDMVGAIERVTEDPGCADALVAAGAARVAGLGGPYDMAREYLEVFQAAVRPRPGAHPRSLTAPKQVG